MIIWLLIVLHLIERCQSHHLYLPLRLVGELLPQVPLRVMELPQLLSLEHLHHFRVLAVPMLAYEMRFLIMTLQGEVVLVEYVLVAGVFVANMALFVVLHVSDEQFLVVESDPAELAERVVDGDGP